LEQQLTDLMLIFTPDSEENGKRLLQYLDAFSHTGLLVKANDLPLT
jgi:hypothetical protein